MIHVGIDLHANNMVIVAINSNGKVVREAKLPSSTRALDDFFSTFDEPVQAVVECTSCRRQRTGQPRLAYVNER